MDRQMVPYGQGDDKMEGASNVQHEEPWEDEVIAMNGGMFVQNNVVNFTQQTANVYPNPDLPRMEENVEHL